jgi:cytoskeleton protein RodZ
MMSSFGENLRREREMRGVTLEEISAATKISVRFLQCVENEDFAKLPGGIFVRSFIRSYARYLGLDEEALLAEFQLLTKDKTGTDLSRLVASRPAPQRRPRSAWRAIALTIAVAGLLAAGFTLWRRSRQLRIVRLSASEAVPQAPKPKPSVAPPPAAANSSSSPAASAGGSPVSGSTGTAQPTATPGGNGPEAAAQSATPPEASGGLVLQIAATERSWVAVDADGKTVLQGVFEPGQVKTVQAQKAFDVVTGNAQGIVLTLNGQTLKPLGREGEVKSVHLTRDDLKNAGP